jgi:hypothetical protein
VSSTRARGPRTVVGLLAAFGLVAALALPAAASHVVPTPVNEGNPTCSSFDSSWTEFKIEGNDLANGTYSDGTLEITLSNFANNQFDWESNLGVDAVFVKAGSDKHNLYEYDPEATSDDGLTAQDGQGNGISHISFCYDTDDATPTPTPTEEETATPTPTPTPAEETASPTPTPSESEEGEEETPAPTATPREDEAGGNPTPTPGTLPDTATGGLTGTPAALLALVMMAALGATVYTRLARQR